MVKYYVPLMKYRKNREAIVAYVTIYAESRDMAYEVAEKTYESTNLHPCEPLTEEPTL